MQSAGVHITQDEECPSVAEDLRSFGDGTILAVVLHGVIVAYPLTNCSSFFELPKDASSPYGRNSATSREHMNQHDG